MESTEDLEEERLADEVWDDEDDWHEPDPNDPALEKFVVTYTVFRQGPGEPNYSFLFSGDSGVCFNEDEAGIITKHSVIGGLMAYQQEGNNK